MNDFLQSLDEYIRQIVKDELGKLDPGKEIKKEIPEEKPTINRVVVYGYYTPDLKLKAVVEDPRVTSGEIQPVEFVEDPYKFGHTQKDIEKRAQELFDKFQSKSGESLSEIVIKALNEKRCPDA